MKITRNQAAYIGVAIILVLLAGLSYFAPERDEQIKLTSSYPATVCPAPTASILFIVCVPVLRFNPILTLPVP